MRYLNNTNAGLRSKEPISIPRRDAVGSNPALYCFYPQRDIVCHRPVVEIWYGVRGERMRNRRIGYRCKIARDEMTEVNRFQPTQGGGIFIW